MSIQPLFTPFKLKSLNLRNRFVMAPMTRGSSPDGIPSQEVTDYYARRAAGDVGLILSEGTVVDRPASKNQDGIPNFYGNALPGWKNVIDSVHKSGGQMGAQLWHVGLAKPDPAGWLPAAPFEGPQNMSLGDVQAAIAAFGQAAADAKALGFDTIELHAAHGYLIDQFFWSHTNTRTDEYGGGTIKERSRFAVDVIKCIRKAIGPDMALIIRLSQWKMDDFAAKIAQTPQELEEWLSPLALAGVDIIHASQRRFWEPEFAGSDLNLAGWAKKITGLPTITVGSVGLSSDFITSFSEAKTGTSDFDELIRRYERGDFDLVAVGRAVLQDPNWVAKVREGKTHEIKEFTAASIANLY